MSERTTENRPGAEEGSPHVTCGSYGALFSLVRDAIFVVNAETGMMVDANPAAEALTGRALSEIRKLHQTHLHPSEDAERARCAFAGFAGMPASERNRQSIGPSSIVHRDGHRIPVDILLAVGVGQDGADLVFAIAREVSDSTQALYAFRKSEERFRQIAELTGEFIWEVDSDGLYTYASPVVEQVLGYKPEEVVDKKHFYDFFVPESREEMKNAAFAVIRRREPFRAFPNLNVRKDGAIVALESTGLPIYDPYGAFAGYRGADRDVTERQRAEGLLRAVMDSSPDPIFVKERAGRMVLANPATLAAIQKPEEEVLGKTDEEIYTDPAVGRQLMVNDRHVMETGQTLFVEEVIPGPVGPRVFFSAKAPYRDPRGCIIGLIGIARDITERKRAEQALRESELKYRRLHESITDAVVTHDMDGHILEFNPAYSAMLGYSGDELRRLTYQQLTVERWHALEEQIVTEQVLREGYSDVYEKEYRRRDGTVFPVELRRFLLLDEKNQPAGMWAIVRDISERKRAEKVLQDSERRFRLFFNNSLHAVMLTHTGGAINAANPAACAMFRMTEQEICSAGRGGLVVNDDRLRAALETRSLTGRVQAELTYVRRDGTTLEGEFSSAVLGEDGGAFVMIRDITERKRAEEALRESEQRLRNLFENATVGIYRTTPAGRIEMANPALVRMLGYESFANLSDRNLEDSGFEPQYVRSTFRNILEERGELHGLEATWMRRDGSTLFVRESARCVRDESGAIRYYEGIVEDISDRKRMEDALRESEQKFATAFRLGPAAMLILDLENGDRILDVNEGFEEATGYDRSDLLGRSVTELGLWPQSEECAAGEARFGMDARFRNLEFQFLRKTGEIRTGLISVEPMEINNRRCAITCTIDITDRKQAEAALLESEERFRNMADTAPVMIWVSGPDNLGTFFNKAWLDFTGRTMEEEVGEGWINGVHSDDLDYCLGTCGASFEARRAFQLEFRLRRADGEYRWIVDTGAPRYRHGEFIGYIGSCLDVTDARRAQAESFARQKLESLGTLAAGIAHDFNNLLGGVLAQAELAAEELAAGSEPNEELKGIRDAAVRGSEIVLQLMIYAGKESDVLEPIDISSNVEEMLGLLKASVSKHATLVTDLDDDLPAVNARAAQIRQILMNLVVNASDAIRNRDGVIRVATDRVTVDRDIATALAEQLPEGDYVQLEVSDTGSGMSPETQARMFDPFFSTKSAGRGLGLAVIHGIVRSLQGAIRISSELGKGSTFQVLLPSVGAPAGRTDTGASVAEALPPSAKGTVLVVEDESSLRLAVSKILGKAGFTVFEADNGSKAIEVLCARGAEVDLLFLDMTLPGRPSDEVLAEALRTRRDMKVILTSAYSEEMVKQTLSAPQVRGFVRKPFRLGTVVEAVRSALLSEAT